MTYIRIFIFSDKNEKKELADLKEALDEKKVNEKFINPAGIGSLFLPE